MRLRFVLPVATLGFLFGCGLLGLDVKQARCNVPSKKQCNEYTDADPGYGTTARTVCTGFGGELKENVLCDQTGAVGGCRFDDGNAIVTVWYFEGHDAVDGKDVSTPDGILAACKGVFVDANRTEYSSDAGMPSGCAGYLGDGGFVNLSVTNNAPLTLNANVCLPGTLGPTGVGDIDAGATVNYPTVRPGQGLWFRAGNTVIKAVVVPSTDSTVALP